jgi:hypothetical protein
MVLARVQRARASMGGGGERGSEVRGTMELDGGGGGGGAGGWLQTSQAVQVCPDPARAASALIFTAHSPAWPHGSQHHTSTRPSSTAPDGSIWQCRTVPVPGRGAEL